MMIIHFTRRKLLLGNTYEKSKQISARAFRIFFTTSLIISTFPKNKGTVNKWSDYTNSNSINTVVLYVNFGW